VLLLLYKYCMCETQQNVTFKQVCSVIGIHSILGFVEINSNKMEGPINKKENAK
jgi:hypothetical protein